MSCRRGRIVLTCKALWVVPVGSLGVWLVTESSHPGSRHRQPQAADSRCISKGTRLLSRFPASLTAYVSGLIAGHVTLQRTAGTTGVSLLVVSRSLQIRSVS